MHFEFRQHQKTRNDQHSCMHSTRLDEGTAEEIICDHAEQDGHDRSDEERQRFKLFGALQLIQQSCKEDHQKKRGQHGRRHRDDCTGHTADHEADISGHLGDDRSGQCIAERQHFGKLLRIHPAVSLHDFLLHKRDGSRPPAVAQYAGDEKCEKYLKVYHIFFPSFLNRLKMMITAMMIAGWILRGTSNINAAIVKRMRNGHVIFAFALLRKSYVSIAIITPTTGRTPRLIPCTQARSLNSTNRVKRTIIRKI